MFNLADELDTVQNIVATSMKAGMSVERKKTEVIIAAYERAVEDPKTVIPTYLMAAIEAAR